MQYREKYTSEWIDSTAHEEIGVETNDVLDTYITGLTYGKTYEFRAVADNTVLINDEFLGGIVESNIVKFRLITDDDTTTGSSDITETFDEWLAQYNLNNTGGKMLVTIIALLLAFVIIVFIPGKDYKRVINVSVPIAGMVDSVILVFAMAIGYVPVFVTIILVLIFAGVTASFIIRLLRGGGSTGGDEL
jgi:hypothetical protein